MWGHCITKQILTGVINQSNNVINLLSKATAICSFEESINSIDLFRRLGIVGKHGMVAICSIIDAKCKKLNSLKQCLTATRPTSHN